MLASLALKEANRDVWAAVAAAESDPVKAMVLSALTEPGVTLVTVQLDTTLREVRMFVWMVSQNCSKKMKVGYITFK